MAVRANRLILFALVALPGCTRELPREERVVLEVAGRPVTMGELDRFVATSVQRESPFLSSDVMAALFDDFIEEQLLLQAAEDAGIAADPRAVGRRIEAMRGDAPSSTPSIRTSDDAMAETVGKQVRVQRLLETQVLGSVEVTDEEVAAYYDSHRDYFKRPETVDVSQILVEDEALAGELRDKLLKKEASFEALAAAHSVGPEAENGGRLGPFARGELPPSFEANVFALAPRKISDVVVTDFGFHIFRVNERSQAQELPLEEVRDLIRVDLVRERSDEAVAAYVLELRKRYPVTVHREHLSFALVDREENRTAGDAMEVGK
jgi:peptidyl-prolyl cis-trans isomerase C